MEKNQDKELLFIFGDNRIKNILLSIEELKDSDSNILITGETGAGKTYLAKFIYKKSRVKNANLVIVNCASIPQALLESELFGYKKGAFTDAKSDKKGLIEEANNGTIVLDEIGDMPFEMQGKILDLIDEKRYRKLGDSNYYEANVRIIALTNKDLKKEIEKGNFREDLYYRLNVVHFHIPPLRERKEDIPLLINHFLTKYIKKYNKNIEGIDKSTLDILLNYTWPGNIRELENIIERLVLFEKRRVITDHNLPLYLKKAGQITYISKSFKEFFKNTITKVSIDNLPKIEEIERIYIEYVYSITSKNKNKTSKILGIDRSTLYNKLRKYHIK